LIDIHKVTLFLFGAGPHILRKATWANCGVVAYLPMPGTRPDPYRVLGVPKTATHAQIGEAFAALAKTLHPDTAGVSRPEEFLAVKEAYDCLRTPERRREFDASRRFGRSELRTHFDSAWYQERASEFDRRFKAAGACAGCRLHRIG
jgi:curved DNA-binding protein CbpA